MKCSLLPDIIRWMDDLLWYGNSCHTHAKGCSSAIPVTVLLLWHCAHYRHFAHQKLYQNKTVERKAASYYVFFLRWERKYISNQGEHKAESIMAWAPNFISGCSLKAFKTLPWLSVALELLWPGLCRTCWSLFLSC